MYDERDSHPLLAQVPLTVSPFVSLPTATTLPYTYKTLPQTLPPSSTEGPHSSQNGSDNGKHKFITSSSGQAAHPDDIIASCQSLQAHLAKQRSDGEKALAEWEQDIRDRQLAEKRRVAPGYLDREEKILEPERLQSTSPPRDTSIQQFQSPLPDKKPESRVDTEEAEQLDRAFGGMNMR